MELNKSQLQSVCHDKGPMMVLAGPGSGKTMVITHRVKWLIEHAGVHPAGILVVTFTKAAADEMRQRFVSLMDGRTMPVSFGTFHAIFFSVLKHAYNYTASNIIREEQKQQLIREIIEDMPVEPDNVSEFVNDVLSEILSEALVAVGGPKFDDADRELAKKFFDLYTPSEIEAALKRLSYNYENWEDYRTIPLVEEVGPYKKTSAYGFGSTDVGDASYAAPTAQMNVATYANGTPGHSWNVTAQVNSSITHKALVTVAEALSLACILTIERPEAVKAAREEYIKSTGGKYICPVGMDAKPELEHV